MEGTVHNDKVEQYLNDKVKPEIKKILAGFSKEKIRPTNAVDMLKNYFSVSEKKEIEAEIRKNEILQDEIKILTANVEQLEAANKSLADQMNLVERPQNYSFY